MRWAGCAWLSFCWILVAGACSCDGRVEAQAPELSSNLELDPTGLGDYVIDFGLVAVGVEATRTIEVRNTGSSPLVLRLPAAAQPFRLKPDQGELSIGVGQRRELVFGFAPTEPTSRPAQAIVALSTNEAATVATKLVRLVGSGVAPTLACEPSPLDFGQVVRGLEKTRTITCTNPLSVPLELDPPALSGNHAASFRLIAPAPVAVGAQESVELELGFRGEVVGRNDASLALRDRAGQLVASLPLIGETVSDPLQLDPSTCLDFGFVGVGERKELPLGLRNLGSTAITIERLVVSEEGRADFSIQSQLPLELPPGMEEAAEVLIEFHPSTGGRRFAEVSISHSGKEPLVGCVVGFGGGPKIECSPASIDFGVTALGMSRSRILSCINAGEAPEGSSVDPMVIGGITSSDEAVFGVSLRNQDGSTVPKERGYPIGDGFILDVVYGPDTEGFDAGTIGILTNAAIGGRLETAVSGEGRDLPPCVVSVIPPLLRFGVVEAGSERRRSFAIRNELETACLIEGLRLSDDSDPAWQVEPIEQLELGGLETLEVEVRFSPLAHRTSIAGEVIFDISEPTEPGRTVALEGSSAEPCLLVDPAELDFGRAGVGCHSRERTISVRNVCRSPLTVTGLALDQGLHAANFQITGRPLLPKVLHANEWLDLQVRFDPLEEGRHRGSVEVAVDTSSGALLYLAPMVGEAGDAAGERTDTFIQKALRKVDILWVMDNSGSFAPYQERISANLPAFTSYADEQGIDYQIGVTTTGLKSSGLFCPGGAEGGEDGRLFPIDGSHPRILTAKTPDLAAHWQNNMRVGTCHSDEFAYDAAYRALSAPLIEEVKDSRYRTPWNDGNAGFLRPDAALSIIFVTDEVEQSGSISGKSPAEYIEFFRRIKGLQNAGQFKAHAITGPIEGESRPDDCTAESGEALRAGVDLTLGEYLSICTPTWDHAAWEAGLRKMSGAAFSFKTRYFLSSEPSRKSGSGRVREEDLLVVVNGEPIEPTRPGTQVWSYDPISNAIDFTPLFIPKAGSEIRITYKVACLID